MAKELTGKTDKRKGAGLWVVVQFLWANLFGLGLAALVFGILPGLQIVTGGGQKTVQVRDFSSVAPPPPPTMEDEPPPPDEAEPEPPPPAPDLQPMSLADALGSINPVGGGGAGVLGPVGGGAMEGMLDSIGGGGLEQKPTPMSQVAPKIPSSLSRQKLSGRIEVEFVVDAQGRVQNARVVRSFNSLLNQAVLDAIKQWRFKPGMRGNKPVPMKTKMPFKFDS